MPEELTTSPAAAAGTFAIGGDLIVDRMGYGAMRVTGPGIWGPPADKAAALATLRRAVELGVNLIDTADSYGPYVSEDLIAEALYPYPSGLVIATKGGWERPGPGQWTHNASPKYLAEAVEGSLKRLRLERIDVYQLHVPDPAVSFEASVGALAGLREQGKIRHVALSNVTREHIERARRIVPIVSVQNRYSFADRESDFIVDYCEQNSIAFLPWAPLGQAKEAHEELKKVADELHATPLQVALAWLLRRSRVILPIPGTSSVKHLEENLAAAALELPQEAYERLSSVDVPPASLRGWAVSLIALGFVPTKCRLARFPDSNAEESRRNSPLRRPCRRLRTGTCRPLEGLDGLHSRACAPQLRTGGSRCRRRRNRDIPRTISPHREGFSFCLRNSWNTWQAAELRAR
jgi:pyridoxine 4-dehydrogenase